MAWTVRNDTGFLRDVLLCKPEHYAWQAVNQASRDTLARGEPLDATRLTAQFGELEAALEQAGVRRHYLAPEPHLPYHVYTRDAGVMMPWGLLFLQLWAEPRRGEYASILAFCAENQVPVWRHATAGRLEGGDIHLIRDGLALIGVSGERTSRAGAEQAATWLRDEGWEVRLVAMAPHFLHYDILFSMAAPNLATACLDVMDLETADWLRRQGLELIDVPYRDAVRAGCNLLALGEDRVISPRQNADLNGRLRALGIEVLDPDYDLFTKGGGGVRCTTMPLRRD